MWLGFFCLVSVFRLFGFVWVFCWGFVWFWLFGFVLLFGVFLWFCGCLGFFVVVFVCCWFGLCFGLVLIFIGIWGSLLLVFFLVVGSVRFWFARFRVLVKENSRLPLPQITIWYRSYILIQKPYFLFLLCTEQRATENIHRKESGAAIKILTTVSCYKALKVNGSPGATRAACAVSF